MSYSGAKRLNTDLPIGQSMHVHLDMLLLKHLQANPFALVIIVGLLHRSLLITKPIYVY